MSFWETQKAQKGALMRLKQGPEGARPLCPPTASPFRELRHTLSWSIVVTGVRPAHTMDAGRPRADALAGALHFLSLSRVASMEPGDGN